MPVWGAAAVLALALSACGGDGSTGGKAPGSGTAGAPRVEAFKAVDVTGARHAQRLEGLVDPQGRERSLAEFRGKAVLVFFGFTQCPDVCPTTLAEAAEAVQLLGPDADRVQVLFVTLDPARDSPEVLSKYASSFDPRFIALRGDEARTREVAQHFKVFFEKVPGRAAGSYTLDHTAASYVFDPQGRLRLYVRHGQGAQALAHDLALLLAGR